MTESGRTERDLPSLLTAAGGLLTLANLIGALKAVPRTGWLDRELDPLQVESVADHSFGVALLAWVAAVERQDTNTALDPERVLLLALVHDLAEAVTGDQPPYDRAELSAISDPEARCLFLERRHIRPAAAVKAKQTAEDTAMRELIHALPEKAGDAIGQLWQELKSGTSAEAKFVKQVDRLETFLQSRRYRAEAPLLPIESFEREVRETIDDPLLRAIRDAALAGEPG